MKERDLQAWLLRRLRTMGGYWTNTTGSVHTARGTPDIVGLWTGMYVALEVKAEKGRVHPLQRWTLEEIEKHGGHAHLIRGRQEAEAFVQALEEGIA